MSFISPKRFLVEIGYLDRREMRALAAAQPEVLATVSAFRKATTSPKPPICAACDAEIRDRPLLWVLFMVAGEMTISGLCDGCTSRDRVDLERAIAEAAGIERFDIANVFAEGGRA